MLRLINFVSAHPENMGETVMINPEQVCLLKIGTQCTIIITTGGAHPVRGPINEVARRLTDPS